MARVTRSVFLHGGAASFGAAVLAACGAPGAGSTGTSGSAASGSTGTTAQGASTSAPASPAKRPTTLLLGNDWTAGDRRKIIDAWLARANQVYPHIKTDLADNADTQEKIIAQFAADLQGDLVMVDQHLVPVFGPKNVLEDISSTVASLKFDFNSIFDIQNITSFGGKRHGMLVQLNSNVWVYNKSMFQQFGVAEPTANWTWLDHLDAARRLSKPDEGRWGMRVRADVYPWFWQAGVEFLAPDGKKTLFDSGPARAVWQHVVEIVTRHRAAPSALEETDKKPAFQTGGYATIVQSSPGAPLTKQIDGKFVWEVMPTPKHPTSGKPPALVVTGHNWAITKKATQRGNLTEAAQVLIELYHKEVQELYNNGSLAPGSLPILKSVATSPEALKPPPQNAKVIVDQVPTGRNYDKIVGFLDMHRVIGPELDKAIDGLQSANDAAAQVQQLADAALANAAR
jgi:multiple sugar transport system substrate-binding protein